MSFKCCITNCTSSKYDVHLHAFPRSEKRYRSWLRSINDPALLQLNKNQVVSSRRVCRKHFEEKFIRQTPGKGNRFILTPNACPTLFTAHEIESRKPNRNKTGSNSIAVHLRDHIYNLDSGLEISTSIGMQSVELNTRISGNLDDPVPQVESASAEKQSDSIDLSQNFPDETDLDWEVTSDTVLIPEAETEDAEGKRDVFSWEVANEPELVNQDEPEHTDDMPDDLAMYCDDDANLMTVKEVGRKCWHQGFHCDNCNGDIIGFRYTCVQCSNLDLCVTCESNGAHAHHYMLRIPEPRPYNEIQTVLARLRKLLMKEFDPISGTDVNNDDAISVKSEIKSEDEADVGETTEQVDTPAEDTEKSENRISSSESQCSDNTDCDVEPDNNRPIQEEVKISNEEKRQRIPLVLLNNIDSIVANSSYRKNTVKLSDSVKPRESNQSESTENADCEVESDSNKHIQQQVKFSNQLKNQRLPVVLLNNIDSIVPNTSFRKYIDKLSDSGSSKESSESESTVGSTAKCKFIKKLPESVKPKESDQLESIVASTAKQKYIMKLPDSLEPKESNQSESIVASTAKRKFIMRLPDSLEKKESNQPESTVASTVKQTYIVKLADSLRPKESNRPESTLANTVKQTYILKLPDSLGPTQSNQSESTVASTSKQKYIVTLPDSLEPKASNQPESTVSSTVKQTCIVKLPDSLGPTQSNQLESTVANTVKQKYIVKLPGSLEPKEFNQPESIVANTVKQAYIVKLPDSLGPTQSNQSESTVDTTVNQKYIVKLPDYLQPKESNQPESIVASTVKQTYIVKLPDSLGPTQSNQLTSTVASTVNQKYIVKLPDYLQPKESNQPESIVASTLKQTYVVKLPDSLGPKESNPPESTVTSTAKRKCIMKLSDSLGPKESDQPESTVANTAKRKYIMKMSESDQSVPAKKISIMPSTTTQEMINVPTIHNPDTGPDQVKYKIVKLPPGALIKQGRPVSLQVYAPKKSQSNTKGGES